MEQPHILKAKKSTSVMGQWHVVLSATAGKSVILLNLQQLQKLQTHSAAGDCNIVVFNTVQINIKKDELKKT